MLLESLFKKADNMSDVHNSITKKEDVGPAVGEPAVRKGSIRNVMIAMGLFFAIPAGVGAYAGIINGEGLGRMSWVMRDIMMSPLGLALGAILVALFFRSFWDVLVTRGMAARTAAVGGAGFYGLLYVAAPVLFFLSAFMLPVALFAPHIWAPVFFGSGLFMKMTGQWDDIFSS